MAAERRIDSAVRPQYYNGDDGADSQQYYNGMVTTGHQTDKASLHLERAQREREYLCENKAEVRV